MATAPEAIFRHPVLKAFLAMTAGILALTAVARRIIAHREDDRAEEREQLLARTEAMAGTPLTDPALPAGVLVVDLVPADEGFVVTEPATIRLGPERHDWTPKIRVRFEDLEEGRRYPIAVAGPYATEPIAVTLPSRAHGARLAVRAIPLDPLANPGVDHDPTIVFEKRMEVEISDPRVFQIRWLQGSIVVSALEVPRGAPAGSPDRPIYPALAARVIEEWKAQGSHRDPSDRRIDQAIVRAPPGAAFSEIFAVSRSIFAPRRQMSLGDGNRHEIYAFNVSVQPPLPPREPPTWIIDDAPSAGVPHPGSSVRLGAITVSGRLPPEVIQRFLRQATKRVQRCYDGGLARNPSLGGRVAIRFVIGADGAVGMASNGGSDLPDNNVVQCVVHVVDGLSFPQPERGIATVVAPFLLFPGR